MLDVAIPALTSAVAPALQGMKFKRLGNRHWGACPTNIYPARDGEILIFCLTEAHWRTLAKLMGHEELIADARCRNHGARLKIADELDALVSEWTSAQARDAIVEGLIEAGIPCAPVRTVDEVIADPETAQRRRHWLPGPQGDSLRGCCAETSSRRQCAGAFPYSRR